MISDFVNLLIDTMSTSCTYSQSSMIVDSIRIVVVVVGFIYICIILIYLDCDIIVRAFFFCMPLLFLLLLLLLLFLLLLLHSVNLSCPSQGAAVVVSETQVYTFSSISSSPNAFRAQRRLCG